MKAAAGSDVTVLSPVFVGADGETATAPSTFAATVTRYDGTAVTVATPVAAGTGVLSVTVPAVSTATLDRLTVTWVATVAGATQTAVTYVNLVGGFYALPYELRAMPGLADTEKYPTADLIAARDEFESLADRYLGVAHVPRFAYETVPFREPMLVAHRPVRVVRTMTSTSPQFLNMFGSSVGATGIITFPTVAYGLTSTATVVAEWAVMVAYEHGYDSPPEPLRRACREYVRSSLLRAQSGMSRDVISQSMGDGTMTRYSTPDWSARRPTGWLDVDRLLNSLPAERVPGVA